MTNTENELFAQNQLQLLSSLWSYRVISQLIIVYTAWLIHFVGQSGDPNREQVHLCMPMLSAQRLCESFGIGGSSLIQMPCRGDSESQTCCFIQHMDINFLFPSLRNQKIYLFRPVLLPAFGANEGTYELQSVYFLTISSVRPYVLSTEFAPGTGGGSRKQASYGMMIGAGLNIIRPIFITVLICRLPAQPWQHVSTDVVVLLHHLIRRQQINYSTAPEILYTLGHIHLKSVYRLRVLL